MLACLPGEVLDLYSSSGETRSRPRKSGLLLSSAIFVPLYRKREQRMSVLLFQPQLAGFTSWATGCVTGWIRPAAVGGHHRRGRRTCYSPKQCRRHVPVKRTALADNPMRGQSAHASRRASRQSAVWRGQDILTSRCGDNHLRREVVEAGIDPKPSGQPRNSRRKGHQAQVQDQFRNKRPERNWH